jgi:hypothetical protein
MDEVGEIGVATMAQWRGWCPSATREVGDEALRKRNREQR